MKTFAQNEPVATTAVIMALLYMLISLNVISLNEDQLTSIENFLVVAMPMIFMVGGGLIARQFVTPVAKIDNAAIEPAE